MIPSFEFGRHWSYSLHQDPKRLAFVLARYQFAQNFIRPGSSILELGCSEGIGVPILTRDGNRYTGVDFDESAIKTAQKNFPHEGTFFTKNFMNHHFGPFQSIVSLDVIEHIDTKYENMYFETIQKNLASGGTCVIGTPNDTATPYASEASKMGHINLYTQERLISVCKKYFKRVLPFGMNDELAHTGFSAMAHYIFAVGLN